MYRCKDRLLEGCSAGTNMIQTSDKGGRTIITQLIIEKIECSIIHIKISNYNLQLGTVSVYFLYMSKHL